MVRNQGSFVEGLVLWQARPGAVSFNRLRRVQVSRAQNLLRVIRAEQAAHFSSCQARLLNAFLKLQVFITVQQSSYFKMSTDAKRFEGARKPYGGGWGPRKSVSQDGKPVGDLRSVLAKKQTASITDLRTKLKPKALYTSNLASRSQSSMNYQGVNGTDMRGPGRKPLKLTAPFKNSVSSAVSGSSSKSSHERSRSAPMSQTRSRSSKLPSYEEAKKISVTVPGLSRPMSEVRG